MLDASRTDLLFNTAHKKNSGKNARLIDIRLNGTFERRKTIAAWCEAVHGLILAGFLLYGSWP
jgi:hypothetical protein